MAQVPCLLANPAGILPEARTRTAHGALPHRAPSTIDASTAHPMHHVWHRHERACGTGTPGRERLGARCSIVRHTVHTKAYSRRAPSPRCTADYMRLVWHRCSIVRGASSSAVDRTPRSRASDSHRPPRGPPRHAPRVRTAIPHRVRTRPPPRLPPPMGHRMGRGRRAGARRTRDSTLASCSRGPPAPRSLSASRLSTTSRSGLRAAHTHCPHVLRAAHTVHCPHRAPSLLGALLMHC